MRKSSLTFLGWYILHVYNYLYRVFLLGSLEEQDSSGSNIVKRITFQEFAPGLEHLDLVNSGIREIDKVVKSIIAI